LFSPEIAPQIYQNKIGLRKISLQI
jgi:hypothetical protein